MELKFRRETDPYDHLERRRQKALERLDFDEIVRIYEEIRQQIEGGDEDERLRQIAQQCRYDMRDLNIYFGEFSS